MQERNKNKKISLTDLIRYRDNKMNGKERNALERELQKDPFRDEAEEGFSMISPETAADDMTELQKRLMKATRKRSLYLFYRIAAAVAVLILISSLFVITRHEKQPVTLSQNISKVEKAPVPVTGPEKTEAQTIMPAAAEKAVSQPTMAQRAEQIEKKATDEEIIPEIQEPEMKEAEEANAFPAGKVEEAAAKRAFVDIKETDAVLTEGKSVKGTSNQISIYAPPQPVAGRDTFNIYIEKNIRNPQPGKAGQQVVSLSFLVRRDSTISGIKILSTPGEEYSKEAIRLIKEGPVWKPATENGIIAEDSVKMNIVFR